MRRKFVKTSSCFSFCENRRIDWLLNGADYSTKRICIFVETFVIERCGTSKLSQPSVPPRKCLFSKVALLLKMNQENIYTNTASLNGEQTHRPKSIFFWNNHDVMKWLQRHCNEYFNLYGQNFLEHEITGRSLIRLDENTLERMGIQDAKHRDEICRFILKLKLKSDILEMKDLERKSDFSLSSSVAN